MKEVVQRLRFEAVFVVLVLVLVVALIFVGFGGAVAVEFAMPSSSSADLAAELFHIFDVGAAAAAAAFVSFAFFLVAVPPGVFEGRAHCCRSRRLRRRPPRAD